MRIGILGSGLMGGKLGTIFARAGHEVVFSYARAQQKLNRLAREANGNARAGTPAEAAQNADAILLAVHWSRIDDVLNQAGDLSGRVIVSCSLPMNRDDTELIIGHTWSGSEELAKRLPKARIVSAFNTVPSEVLFEVYQSWRRARRPCLVYCGDDRRSKKLAADLIRDVGFDPVDAGPLRIARYTEPFALWSNHSTTTQVSCSQRCNADLSDGGPWIEVDVHDFAMRWRSGAVVQEGAYNYSRNCKKKQ